MRREDRRKLLLTWPLLAYSKIIEIKHGSEHLPKTKLICAFQHHLSSRMICLPLPTSKRVDIHEVNCYSNCPTLHRMMIATFNSLHAFAFTIVRFTNQWYMPTVTISPLVIIGCYQLTDMIPPPAATTLMLPDIHSIEFLDGWYFAYAPPAQVFDP